MGIGIGCIWSKKNQGQIKQGQLIQAFIYIACGESEEAAERKRGQEQEQEQERGQGQEQEQGQGQEQEQE